MSKYVDGVSDLDLYITKKLMNNQTTSQVLKQIQRISKEEVMLRGRKHSIYMEMDSMAKTSPQFYSTEKINNGAMSRTGMNFTQPESSPDKQLIQQFDRFIQKKQTIEPNQKG